jgi:para-aminobenzoate synthetase component I
MLSNISSQTDHKNFYLCSMQQSEFIQTCNAWAEAGTPFLFIIDYELEQFLIFRPEEAAGQGIFYDIRGRTNVPCPWGEVSQEFRDVAPPESMAESGPGSRNTAPPGGRTYLPSNFRFEAVPMAFPRYEKAFSLVKKHILHGNSFLLNLTFPTPVRTDLGLEQIFHASVAPYRLLYGDRFVVFSPETFVTIGGNTIRSFPMKGTIDAALPDAERRLLENEKELWEHNTIVDLIRNDLSMVSADVRVARFRYIDRIRTHRGELLQVSSEIEGRLGDDWRSGLGELLLRMLPAGSICGAPKRKTLEIIAEAEGEKRGFFTGIFGIFDGASVDSAVMIRYIERAGALQDVGNAAGQDAGNVPGKQPGGKQPRGMLAKGSNVNLSKVNLGKTNGGLQFRSGGGITGHSEAEAEYREMIEKVYLPIVRE